MKVQQKLSVMCHVVNHSIQTVTTAAITLCIAIITCSTAFSAPSAQINIPSTDAKGLGEVAIAVTNYAKFSSKPDTGTNLFSAGVETGVLPFEKVKLEIGADYNTSGTSSVADDHPIYFNAKLATAEDLFFSGMPAIAVGAYNLGSYDKPERQPDGLSTRQNVSYALLAKTLPVIGRLSVGSYYGSARALAVGSNQSHNNSGVMASWDRIISEVSDKLWLGMDYMSGNNANGEISFGGSWSFTKQVTLLVGVVVYNPFYTVSQADNGLLPGGKPALTTQLTINLP